MTSFDKKTNDLITFQIHEILQFVHLPFSFRNKVVVKPTDKISTLAIEPGNILYVNPEFWINNPKWRAQALLHEFLHSALGHLIAFTDFLIKKQLEEFKLTLRIKNISDDLIQAITKDTCELALEFHVNSLLSEIIEVDDDFFQKFIFPQKFGFPPTPTLTNAFITACKYALNQLDKITKEQKSLKEIVNEKNNSSVNLPSFGNGQSEQSKQQSQNQQISQNENEQIQEDFNKENNQVNQPGCWRFSDKSKDEHNFKDKQENFDTSFTYQTLEAISSWINQVGGYSLKTSLQEINLLLQSLDNKVCVVSNNVLNKLKSIISVSNTGGVSKLTQGYSRSYYAPDIYRLPKSGSIQLRLPSRVKQKTLLAIVIDTSYSMVDTDSFGAKMLDRRVTEILSFLDKNLSGMVFLVVGDEQANGRWVPANSLLSTVQKVLKGGRGTNPDKWFDEIQRSAVVFDNVLVISDGYFPDNFLPPKNAKNTLFLLVDRNEQLNDIRLASYSEVKKISFNL
jgi:hypothetical protein